MPPKTVSRVKEMIPVWRALQVPYVKIVTLKKVILNRLNMNADYAVKMDGI